jgi:NAD(P)-dependent dehydrogenase (short-subunit alcohol dehydrogenase family)
MDPETLKGQVALVTGGGRGIGRAIALKLASAGMCVAVLARTPAETADTVTLAEQAGGVAEPYTADVTEARGLRNAMLRIEHELGPVQLLVNNAGYLGPIGPFHEVELGAWWRAFEVNLYGAAQCTQAVLRGMIDRRQGRIVNIAASAAPFAYLSSYVASKTALMRFTETLAAELEPQGICAFAVIPGTVRTAMSEHSLNSPQGRKWLPWFRQIFAESRDVPADRPASLVLQIARGQVDALSGRVLSVADDLDILMSRVTEIQDRKLYSLRVTTLSTGGADSVLEKIRNAGEQATRYTLQVQGSAPAPPAEVFRLWTDPVAIHRWFVHHAPVHWRTPPRLDVRPGGKFDWNVVSDTNEREVFHFQGSYLEVHAGERLVFTWDWENLPIEGVDGAGRTVVEVDLVAAGVKTTVTLTQTGLANEAACTAHEKGWARCLEGMVQLLSEQEPAVQTD